MSDELNGTNADLDAAMARVRFKGYGFQPLVPSKMPWFLPASFRS